MRTTRPRNCLMIVAALVLGALGAFVGAQGEKKVDVTGSWALEVKTDAGGTTTPSVTLKQEGEKLTGHYSSQNFGEQELTGTVKGNEIKFSFTADAQGTQLTVAYTGTVKSKDAIEGTVDLGGLAQGTFTAKRQ